MFNYEESFLKNVEFSNIESKITGGYVYKTEGKQGDIYGGSLQRGMTVPVGLIVNNYDDNIKSRSGEYIGVIGMDKIIELLGLNYKPLKNITRKLNSTIAPNRTKKNIS